MDDNKPGMFFFLSVIISTICRTHSFLTDNMDEPWIFTDCRIVLVQCKWAKYCPNKHGAVFAGQWIEGSRAF